MQITARRAASLCKADPGLAYGSGNDSLQGGDGALLRRAIRVCESATVRWRMPFLNTTCRVQAVIPCPRTRCWLLVGIADGWIRLPGAVCRRAGSLGNQGSLCPASGGTWTGSGVDWLGTLILTCAPGVPPPQKCCPSPLLRNRRQPALSLLLGVCRLPCWSRVRATM